MNYLKMLVDDFHSTVVATLDQQGYPQTRAIDMMQNGCACWSKRRKRRCVFSDG